MKRKSNFKSERSKKKVAQKKSLYPQQVSILNMHNSNGYKGYLNGKIITSIRPPNHFSIVNNSNETLNFFRKLERDIKHKNNVFINASEVTKLSEDAILYLLSRFNHFKNKDSDFSVGGYFPKHKKCNKMFIESGFPNFVKSEETFKQRKTEMFPIRSGSKIVSKILPDIFNYVRKFIPMEKKHSAPFYGAIIESMQNATEHAYVKTTKDSKWWLIVTPLEDKTKLHFTFLDNGVGIPKTIRLHHSEIVLKISRKLGINNLINNDADLIEKALEGNFRSRTNTPGRGNGLPAILEISNNHQCENLTIISNNGMILIKKNSIIEQKIKLDKKFHGTLITWDFIK